MRLAGARVGVLAPPLLRLVELPPLHPLKATITPSVTMKKKARYIRCSLLGMQALSTCTGERHPYREALRKRVTRTAQ